MTRFALIGGFLGAGKTTLIGELASRSVAQGKRIGIITNDQAADLVDTQNLRAQGFAVGEVAGACFCCSFDEMVAAAKELGADAAPDLLLAEPVGSCTDLVATIILPLQQLLGEQFQLAPFGVMLKPGHGRRILAGGDSQAALSGFSPQAEYIFRKQLEEADYLMIGRADTMDQQQIDELKQRLSEVAPDVPVIAVSPRSGQGVDEVMQMMLSDLPAGQRLLDIDYDTYADGEAELGWVNLATSVQSMAPIDLNEVAETLVRHIGRQIVQQSAGAIAHVKASVSGDGTHAVANLVDNFGDVEVGLEAGHAVKGVIEIVINARVALDPQTLQQFCEKALQGVAADQGWPIESINARSLRPGRPTPTHRVTQA